MEEYRIDVKVRNNVILYKIEQAGYKTLGEFCRLNNIMKYVSTIGAIINMKSSPLQSDGEFRKCIIKVADLLGCDPLDLFTDTQMHTVLKSNKRSIQVNEAEMRFMLENKNETLLLEDLVSHDERNKTIEKALGNLTEREAKVIKLRFGFEDGNEHTLDEVGVAIGKDGSPVSRERVRQIEAKALRKLRHPINNEGLRDFVYPGEILTKTEKEEKKKEDKRKAELERIEMEKEKIRQRKLEEMERQRREQKLREDYNKQKEKTLFEGVKLSPGKWVIIYIHTATRREYHQFFDIAEECLLSRFNFDEFQIIKALKYLN